MNRRQFLATSAVAGLGLLSAPFVARAATRTLRICTTSAENSTMGLALPRFAAAVSELTGGSLGVEVFYSSALGKAPELYQAVLDGTLDMYFLSVDTVPALPKPILALATPFLFQDRTFAHAAYDGALGKASSEILAGVGIEVLGWGENGTRHMTAKKPIRTPADLVGLKLRVPEAPVSMAAFSALGAEPKVVPFVELVPKLKDGFVEAQENPIGNVVSAKLEGLQTHISLTAHTYSSAALGFSAEIAAELTDVERDALHKAGKIAVQVSRDENVNFDSKGLAAMVANGWTVVDDVDHASFAAKIDDVFAAVSEVVGADTLAGIKGLIS